MSKEMIVSVNGREKKIAIIENDQVTEFYIERGEEHQGIVGNIYKGRVMRVLPGMQSAFVDIGLERDAFLYVSDFFDEEEEFERIVMDKAKQGDLQAAERAAAEQIQKVRLEREQLIEATQERVEPLRELEIVGDIEAIGLVAVADEEISPIEEIEVREGERKHPTHEKKPIPTFGIEDESFGRRRNKRKRQREKELASKEEIIPSFGFEADTTFERVADDDYAADEGELLKDAIMQERLTDQVHAVEFGVEDKHPTQVGSIFDESDFVSSSFERVSDDDDSTTQPETAFVQEVITTNAAARIDDVEEITDPTLSFERISDDEGEPIVEIELKGKKTNRKTSKKKKADEEDDTAFDFDDEPKKKRGKKKDDSKVTAKSSRKKKEVKSDAEVATDEAIAVEATNEEPAQYEDAEASVKEASLFSEFATRRGGRRRTRRRSESGNGHGENVNSKDEEIEETAQSNGRGQNKGRGRSSHQSDGRSSQSASAPRRTGAPTITDLLREGQEILVQIAKEPISKKGARITSHIALPGRYLVYMPTIEHLGVSRKIESANERSRLRHLISRIRNEENVPSGGFIVRTAGIGIPDEDLRDDARYLVRLWQDLRKNAEKTKAPAMIHRDLDLVQRILRDHLSNDFNAIRVDSEEEYLRIVEFMNRFQPRMVKRVKLHTRDEPILEAYGVQAEIDKAIKPRVWLKSGGYLVINQTEALVSIDVNTGKFVGKGSTRLEDTITKTNMEAVQEIARQIRLRDLGGIIVMDLIDMEERRNRQKVLQALHDALEGDKSPTKVLSFNDFGLVIMTRKRVKQSLERTLCSPCSYCQGAGLVKSPQTICYEILEESRRLSKHTNDAKQTTLRVNPEVARALRGPEKDVLAEIEEYLGAVDITSDERVHQEQFDFAFV
jgi:ribonuclease G